MASEIGPGTKLNVATLVAVVGAAIWIDRRISIAETTSTNGLAVQTVQNKAEFDKIDLRLKSIESTAAGVADDLWRKSDMRSYIREANAGGSKLPPID